MDFLSNSIIYIFQRFAFRIYYFLYHWYIRGLRRASNWTLSYLEKLDYRLALRVNLKNIFQPLYQDYSIFSYILGFLLRSFRLVLASVIYLVVIFVAGVLLLIWFFIPIYILYQIISSF